jgi:hypothetical protein
VHWLRVSENMEELEHDKQDDEEQISADNGSVAGQR